MPEETKEIANPPRSSGKGRGLWKPALLLIVVLALLILAPRTGLGERIRDLRDWIQAQGPWAPVIFVLVYAAATVAVLPGSPLSIAAGALFGSVMGVVCVSLGSTLGAALSFLVSRYLARRAVAHWLSGSEKFRQLDRMTEEHGAILVAITRLVPLFPFNLINFGFGLTRVPFGTYVFWSWLCMLPGTVLYVVGADALSKAIAQRQIPWSLVLVVAAAVVILVLLVREARRRLGAGSKST